jgi:hypothetical protein
MKSKRSEKLTEADWVEVDNIRWLAHLGQATTSDEKLLCEQAFDEDADRYNTLDAAIRKKLGK